MEFELWIRIIKESIDKKNIEPWNINIAEIADEYIKTLKELKKFDIRLSADVVLVGGILLRMKSQLLYNECEIAFEDKESETFYEGEDYEVEEYLEEGEDNLNYNNSLNGGDEINRDLENKDSKSIKNKKIKKQITFNDLVNTLKSELKKIKKSKGSKRIKREILLYDVMEEMEEEYDVSELMEHLISEVKREKVFIFQEKFPDKKNLIKYFLPSLYLANEGKIEIFQRDLFQEMVLKYRE
ncbi:segregation/condensation protein A [Methanothermococcus sp. SCGC AD-155-C09]|nr:segregation/condensation protein A [Methanothermococcus sp. SCGC AD-155-C09]